jgi:hypothetical protein
MPEAEQQHDLQIVVLQQDGGPPQSEGNVRAFHDYKFPMWSGNRGSAEWPPASPDLTPCDFSIWGIIKDKVHNKNRLMFRK